MEEDQDVYVNQLREVFDSCDEAGTGYLDASELRLLCDKLHLHDQADLLIDQLIGHNQHERVGFEEFKEGFVSVLSDTIEDHVDTSEDDLDDDQGGSTPKLVRGEKTYGRRSRPATDTDELSEGDIVTQPHSKRSRHQEDEDEEVPPIDTGNHEEDEDEEEQDEGPDMFEAEGQMNQTLGHSLEAAGAGGDVGEEEHLRDIWRELGVGVSGYLTIHELAAVCEHIGMDEMNDEELQHLFDKLDTDRDGHVSFDEFLTGLFQHGGSVTPSMTPLSTPHTPRGKLRLSVAPGSEDRQTPAFISVGPAAGIFSALDADASGYATAEAIAEFWEGLGVPQGLEILEYLQFDIATKVNLVDLSYALEQEMRSVEEDNATYQAGIASLEYELRQQRSNHEHTVAERDKLRGDLTEANQRISLLVKESDERSAASERSKEKELLSLEKQYQEQLSSLRSGMETERASLVSQTSKHATSLQSTIDALKEEEARLKDKVTQSQKDIEKLEKEVLDLVGKNTDLELLVSRQQKELEEMDDMQKKLDELESHKEEVLTEQQKFSEQKIKQYVENNKELKDKYDELTMEVEELRQEVTSHRRGQRHRSRRGEAAKHAVAAEQNRSLDEELSENESVTSTDSGKRRRLPATPDEILEKQRELEQARQEAEQLKHESDTRMHELTRGFSLERKDIEDAFKMEIAQLEDTHMREKNDLIKKFNNEKAEMEVEFSSRLAEQVAVEHDKVKDAMAADIEDMLIRHASEKNLMEREFAEQKDKLMQAIKDEVSDQYEHQLSEQESRHRSELERSLSRNQDDRDDLHQQLADLELQLKLQREELELGFSRERAQLEERFDADKCELSEQHRLRLLNHQAKLFSKGPEQLEGHLRQAFEAAVEREARAAVQRERDAMARQLTEERDAMQRDRQQDKALLERSLREELEGSLASDRSSLESSLERERERIERAAEEERRRREAVWQRQKEQLLADIQQEKDSYSAKMLHEREALEKKYRQQIAELQTQVEQEHQMLELERDRFKAQFKRERDNFDKERRRLREELEDSVGQQLQAQMEDEFVQQIARLKTAFEAERGELEARITMYENELAEIREDEQRQQLTSRGQEDRLKRQLQEKNSTIQQLQEANIKLEKAVCDLERQLQEAEVVREEAIVASQRQHVHHAPPTPAPRTDQNSILDAIKNQSELVERKTGELREDISKLDKRGDAEQTQLELNKLVEEKKSLEQYVQNTEVKMRSLQEQAMAADLAKASLERWETEKAALTEQLDITTSRLAETQTALSLANSAHLREMAEQRQRTNETVTAEKYKELHSRLLASEQRTRDLEVALEARSAETSKLIASSHGDHEKALSRLQSEKEGLQDRFEICQKLLDEQVAKLKIQLEKCARSELLVKDLYVENAHLVKVVQLAERREKEAQSRALSLHDRCTALNKVLHKVAPAALSY